MHASRVLAATLSAGVLLISALPATAAVPNTTIRSGPTGLIAKRKATFRFSSNVRGATFQCKLDDNPWRSCESPKTYFRRRQGLHRFKVRARKAGVVDPTPAVRTFRVDTVAPNTTILSGPTGEIEDHNPSFTFSSNDAAATFECKLTELGFKPCSSPFVPSASLPDGSYTFRVRARDAAGNADGTPASLFFGVETPITFDEGTAEAAADVFLPNQIDLDVPASCDGNPPVDCPNGTPLPRADQLSLTANHRTLHGASQNRYDVTVQYDVATIQDIKVDVPGGVGECDLTITSANGTAPTWTVSMSLLFVADVESGDLHIQPDDMNITGGETVDAELSGSPQCDFSDSGLAYAVPALAAAIGAQLFGSNLCAAPGPAYMGPCRPTSTTGS